MNQIIRPHTCNTCPFKCRVGPKIECRAGSPNAQVIMGMVNNEPKPIGKITYFPEVQPEWWCGQHPAIKAAPTMTMMGVET